LFAQWRAIAPGEALELRIEDIREGSTVL
jgi:hypothetical protein